MVPYAFLGLCSKGDDLWIITHSLVSCEDREICFLKAVSFRGKCNTGVKINFFSFACSQLETLKTTRGRTSEKNITEHVKVKRPIKLIRLRIKKKERKMAASAFTRAASLLLLHCLRTLCLCVRPCTYVCVKDTVREGHGGGSGSSTAIEPLLLSCRPLYKPVADSSNHI